MVTVTEFIVRLLTSAVKLFTIFLTDVITNDPLSFISFAIGGALTGFSILFFGYLVLGAIGDLFGDAFSTSLGTPPPRE